MLLLPFLFSCTGVKGGGAAEGQKEVALKYAENIRILDCGTYKKVILKNPWSKEQTWMEYDIRSAYENLLVGTSVHCALFAELGCEKYIKGVCEPQYINLPFVRQGVSDGTIADCGSAVQPDIESVVALSPDAILLSPFEGSSASAKAREAGIPIVWLADYMEPSPLARAEWIIFYGMLVGKEKEARELFEKIEQDYLRYKRIAEAQKEPPAVMFDKMTQATWYVPGGRSTIGQIARDANCRYVFGDDEHSGGVEKSFEQVLDKAMDADIWLLRYSGGSRQSRYSLQSLAEENEKYKLFKPYKERRVYGCDVDTSRFFEETPFHPERLLRDFIRIMHPEADIEGEMRYYVTLK